MTMALKTACAAAGIAATARTANLAQTDTIRLSCGGAETSNWVAAANKFKEPADGPRFDRQVHRPALADVTGSHPPAGHVRHFFDRAVMLRSYCEAVGGLRFLKNSAQGEKYTR